MVLEETHGSRIIRFEAGRLAIVEIDFRVGLLVADGAAQVDIRIGEPFRVERDGRTSTVIPGEAATAAEALSLWNAAVTEVAIASTGELAIHFAGGERVLAPPHDQYEAWELGVRDAARSTLIVCAPGGEVTVFEGPGAGADAIGRRAAPSRPWTPLRTAEDVKGLMREFGNFHDVCVREIHVVSGHYVDERRAMHAGGGTMAHMLVQRQSRELPAIELRFEQVAGMRIAPPAPDYEAVILSAACFLRDGMLYWADRDSWTPEKDDGNVSWVAARDASWRNAGDRLGPAPRYGGQGWTRTP